VVRELGAAAAIDYTDPGWADALKAAAPDGVDVAYDGVGGDIGRTALAAMAGGGRFLIHGVASGAMTDTGAATGVIVLGFGELMKIAQRARELTEQALALAAAGRLRPVIGQTYPLEQAATAHAAIEARTAIGKSLLLPDRS
jgi:NADPH:quinone reductase